VLELNKWFFVQLANFILLFLVLHIILFKPFLRLFKERDDKTKGALKSANEMDKEKDDALAQIDAKLLEARNKAKTVFEDLSREGMEVQKSTLDSTQNEAVEINRKAKEDLEAATEKVRSALKSDIEAFSKQIVDKLVGA
jgi:F-type H+-transporting ATPase subunit b